MTRYVIDADTLLHVVTQEVEISGSHRIVAPGAIRSQALTLLLAAVAQGEITEAEALRRHDLLTGLKMRLLGDRVSRRTAWRIARDHGWPTIDDAEYLAVATLQADALVTVDPAMAERAEGIVAVRPVTALSVAD